MYYGNTILIPVPESSDKGTIVLAKTGYVYLQTDYKWDPVKRQPRYTRTTIGRCPPEQTKLMYYSPEYEKIFGPVDTEVTRLREKYGARELKAVGKINFCLSFGTFALIKAACEKIGALSPLQRSFPDKWKLILGLCVHGIAEESTTSQAFHGWCFSNYCGLNRVPSDSEISKLYKEISDRKGDIKVFFSLLWTEFSTRFPQSQMRTVGFDSTNQNYAGRGIPLAKLGHAKIDIGLPVINTAMFVDEKTGIPLWYEHFDGSVLDKTQTPFSLKKIVNMGYQKLFVVFDRGYYSEEDIVEMEQLEDIEFGVLCPDGTTWVENLIREHGSEIKDKQLYYVPDENVYGNIYEVHPFQGNGNSKLYYAYLFYDSERASDERDTIHNVVNYYWKQAESRKRYSEKMVTDFAGKGIIVQKTEKDKETGKNFKLYEDVNMIQRLLDMKGFFVMLSPTKMNVNDTIHIIRKRDQSEKNFASLMNHFHMRTTWRHTKETYEGIMFVAFIALICLAALRYFERTFLHAVTSRTVATLLDEMAKYQIMRNEKTGEWEPAYAMNKDQKEICKLVGITEGSVQQEVSKIKMK